MKNGAQIALVVAMLATVAGAIVFLFRVSSPDDIEVILPVATAEPEVELKVYVSGAVRVAGVYTLETGDRLEQAISAAGGVTPDADVAAINLALRVAD